MPHRPDMQELDEEYSLIEHIAPKKRGMDAERAPMLKSLRKGAVDTSKLKRHEIAAAVDPNRPLSEKAKLFVRYWARGESVMSASARAGYADGATFAYRLIHYPQAKALYEQEKAEYEAASRMTKKRVMDGFLKAAEMAQLQADPTAMTGAWREIGKLCGYYEPIRVNHFHAQGGEIKKRLEALTDAELVELIKSSASPNPELPPPGSEPEQDE